MSDFDFPHHNDLDDAPPDVQIAELKERIAELEAENANLHDWIDSYCGQPDQTHILKEFNRRIAELDADNKQLWADQRRSRYE